jgi:hypothetical protein
LWRNGLCDRPQNGIANFSNGQTCYIADSETCVPILALA